MRVIGLTGSIACGKSTVSNELVSRGLPVIDGDCLSREITLPGSPALSEIRAVFGPGVFYEDGSLNRRALGRLVFADPAARARLDQLMAPYLLDLTKRRLDEVRRSGAPLCFLDMPLLFEKGYDSLCSSVWTVWLPEDLQLARLMQRDGYPREEALARIRSVLSSDEKAARSDKVIDNCGSVDRTLAVVSQYLAEELSVRPSVPVPSAADAPVFRDPPAAVMNRPSAALRKKQGRTAAWRLPVWLKSALIVLSVFLLAGITAFSLMSAYLQRCSEQHAAEQQWIDNHYPLQYRSLIEQYAEVYNLSPSFVSAVIRNESSFQPRAESGVGARGLMQLMPETAEWIAGKLQVEGYAFERMYDPESNIRFGCWYLNYLSRLFQGDPVCVTAAYHAGQGQVKIWLSDPALSEDGIVLPLTSLPDGPTKNYTERVIRDYGIYQEKYFSVPLQPAGADASVPDSVCRG